jgi:hypothetical protein
MDLHLWQIVPQARLAQPVIEEDFRGAHCVYVHRPKVRMPLHSCKSVL